MPNRIIELRHRTGLSQQVTAQAIGLSPHSYRALENTFPEINVNVKTLAKIADYFGVSMDYLYERETKPSTLVDLSKNWHEQFLARLDLSNKGKRTEPIDLSKLYNPYPYNLIKDIFGLYEIQNTAVVSEQFFQKLEATLLTFSERDRAIIHDRYICHQSYHQLHKSFDISRARIQQIIKASLEELHKRLSHYIFDPEERIQGLMDQIDQYETQLKNLKQTYAQQLLSPITEEYRQLGQTLDKLPLGNRAYNALTAANCKTLMDVLLLIDSNEIHHIRNLGVTTKREIYQLLFDRNIIQQTVDLHRPTISKHVRNAVMEKVKHLKKFSVLITKTEHLVSSTEQIEVEVKNRNLDTLPYTNPSIPHRTFQLLTEDATLIHYQF